MIIAARRRIVATATVVAAFSLFVILGYGIARQAEAASDVVAAAKAAVIEYAGPQTTWKGPTSAPKPAAGMKIVYLSGDEQNDISHEYGVYIAQAAAKLGWSATVIDGKGSPTSVACRNGPSDRAEAERHRDVRGRQEPAARDQPRLV
jgi:hypothetical protein